jgi:ketosteroid isomerase-like protein
MTSSTTATTSGAEAKAVLQEYLDRLVSGDLDAIGKSFAEDATWSVHGTMHLSGVKRGRAAILDFLASAGSLYQPGTQSFTFGEITAEGDRAVLEWRVRGIGAATRRAYDNEYCGVFVIRGGEIVAVREYLDSLHASQILFRD